MSTDQVEAVKRPHVKFIVLVVVVGAAIAGYVYFRNTLTLDNLAKQEVRLREFQEENPILVYGLAFVVYVVVTGLSLPGAAAMTIVYGWYFGLLRGVVLVSFASTTGATLAFLLSRYLLGETIQSRFSQRLATFHRNLEREGAYYLFTLRLIPAVPFFVINLVMGLTPMKARTFWWVSQVGMLPGTIVYVYAGAAVPDLDTIAEKGVGGILTPQLIIAFVLLGLFPLILKQLSKLLTRKRGMELQEAAAPEENPSEVHDAEKSEDVRSE